MVARADYGISGETDFKDGYAESSRTRLAKAIEESYKALDVFRCSRTELIADHAGKLFGRTFWDLRSQKERATLVNTMYQTAEAYQVALAANRPRYLVTSTSVERAGFARHFQEGLNNTVKAIHLEETLQDCTLDAFFGPAFAKVYLAESELVEVEADVWMDPGRPYVSRVSLDDFVFDFDAKDFRLCRFMADKYELPVWLIRETFGRTKRGRRVVDQLINLEKRRDKRHDKTRDLSSADADWGTSDSQRSFEDMITLADVYLPTYGLVLTFGVEDEDFCLYDLPPLSVQEWTDASGETGPYHYLNLGRVPDNILPSSPAIHIKALFELTNSLYQKTANQSRRQKSVGLVDAGDEQQALNIMRAKDGDVVTLKGMSTEGFKEARFGGMDNNVLAGAMHFDQLTDRQGGNLSARAGLGAQAPTAAQERYVAGQVTRHEGYLGNRVTKFAKDIGAHIAELMFNDPVLTVPGTISIPGTDFSYDSPWTPQYREGTFDQYLFDVEPESMPYRSAAERIQAIDQFIMGVVLPALPLLQQQQLDFDFMRYVQMRAELTAEPRLLELIRVAGRVMEDPAGQSHERSMAPQTSREYIRRNEGSGATGPGQTQQMIQSLLSKPSNNGAAA